MVDGGAEVGANRTQRGLSYFDRCAIGIDPIFGGFDSRLDARFGLEQVQKLGST